MFPGCADHSRKVEGSNAILRLTVFDQAVADEEFDRHDQRGTLLLEERRLLDGSTVVRKAGPRRVRLLHLSVLAERFRK
jgi:hypothetical protein